jgi:4-hydroxy-3-polyprenylbenzoate decarboxylase
VNDLRDFVRLLREQRELHTIDITVDPVLEISEITDRVSKAGGPALLFTHPKGSDVPVLTNQFGSERRTCLALRVGSYEDLARRIEEVIDLEMPTGARQKLKMLSRLRDFSGLRPRTVREGVCQDVVLTGEQIDLSALPILKCWPLDGGRYITLPLVFTRDPATGRRNVGMYRMQVYDKTTTGMHWHTHKHGAEHLRASGRKLEVAVAIGTDPALTYAATAPLPPGFDEVMLAGFLRDRAFDMVPCRTVDLEVPADAEIVLEGYVTPGELRREGPFGDHTGYYSLADDYPVLHLTALTHRRDPIYTATIVGTPPMEDACLGKATERLFLPLLRFALPELLDMDLPVAGVFHNCVLVSVRKQYPMHARKVMSALWGTGQMQFSKCIVVLDEGVDVHDYGQVAWRVFNNVDWKRDTVIVDGPLDALDHSSPHPLWGGKIGIDATSKGPDEGHGREWPGDVVMSAEVKARVDALWSELGLPGAPAVDMGPDAGGNGR